MTRFRLFGGWWPRCAIDSLLAQRPWPHAKRSEFAYLDLERQRQSGVDVELLPMAQALGLAKPRGEPLVPGWLRKHLDVPGRVDVPAFIMTAALEAQAQCIHALMAFEPDVALRQIERRCASGDWARKVAVLARMVGRSWPVVHDYRVHPHFGRHVARISRVLIATFGAQAMPWEAIVALSAEDLMAFAGETPEGMFERGGQTLSAAEVAGRSVVERFSQAPGNVPAVGV
jgi:hypothetical protein